MKTALVCGAGGFIGSHLVKRLKEEGFWVRGVDLKYTKFAPTGVSKKTGSTLAHGRPPTSDLPILLS